VVAGVDDVPEVLFGFDVLALRFVDQTLIADGVFGADGLGGFALEVSQQVGVKADGDAHFFLCRHGNHTAMKFISNLG
jgi:hypothetical protein